MARPSGLKATDETVCRWRNGGPIGFSLSIDQSRAMPSTEPVRTVLPSGPKATAWTQCWWRKGWPIGLQVSRSQRARSSVVAAGQDRPSVWTKGDRRDPVSMGKRRADGRPVAASQSRAVLSQLPVRTVRPSGLNATEPINSS